MRELILGKGRSFRCMLAALAGLLAVGCGGGGEGEVPLDTLAPTAVLEAPATAEHGADFTLSGARSADAGGGRIAAYRWIAVTASGGGLTQGVAVETTTPTCRVAASSAPVPLGTQTYRLVVVDDSGNVSAPAEVAVVVRDTRAPTAVLDAPATAEHGADFTLSGARSADVGGGRIAAYRWTAVSASGGGLTRGVAVETTTPTRAVAASASPVPPGTQTYRLVVVDDSGNASAPAEVAVVVRAAVTDTEAPTAVLDAPSTAEHGADFTLSGARSADAGGGRIAAYRWTAVTASGGGLTQGVAVETTTPTRVVAASSAPVPLGSQTYRLVVVDDSGNASAPAEVTVAVRDTRPPTAVLDVTPTAVDHGADFTLSGARSADVGGGRIAAYRWTAVSASGGGLTQGVVVETTTPSRVVAASGSPVPPGTQTYRLVVVDDSGNASAPAEVAVVVRDTRGRPTAVVLNAGVAGPSVLGDQAQVALDGGGNGFAMWPQWSGSTYDIWASRYDAGTGTWEPPVLIDESDWGASGASLAVSPSGEAFVVWAQSYQPVVPGVLYGPVAWARRYDPVAGQWGEPAPISPLDTQVAAIRVETDAAGNAFAAWSAALANGAGRMFANRYDASTQAWQGAQQLDTDVVTSTSTLEQSGPSSPQWSGLTVDQGGNAAVVWPYYDWGNVAGFVVANRYDESTGAWGGAEILATEGTGSFMEDVVSLAGEELLAVWVRNNATSPLCEIRASSYDPGSGTWGAAETLYAADEIDCTTVRAAADGAGGGVLVWVRSTQNGWVQDLWGMVRDPQTGAWGAPGPLESGAERVEQPAVAMDASGQALAVWTQATDASSERIAVGARYDAATGAWGAPLPLAEGLAATSTWPQAGMDGSGGAAVIWQQGARDLMGLVLP